MSANRALGMVREWPQLIKSAAELWAILPPEPTVSASGNPMAILAAMGSALRHSLTAGHWPGHGPTDEYGSRSGRTSLRPDACFWASLWHPRLTRRPTRPGSPALTRRYCTRCMSPRTALQWP